jgi:hypothetical protein
MQTLYLAPWQSSSIASLYLLPQQSLASTADPLPCAMEFVDVCCIMLGYVFMPAAY